MSIRYNDKNNVETICSGITPGGDLEYGAVATRSGVISIPATAAGAYSTIDITFSEELPDANYEINITPHTSAFVFGVMSKTKSGFRLIYRNTYSSTTSAESVEYTAYKLYEVADAEQLYSTVQDLETMIPANASSTNKFTTADDLRTETRTLDRRLDDVEDVVPISASITNKLVTQSDLSGVEIDKIEDINDVELTNIQDGQTLIWDDTNSKWINGQGGKIYTAGDGITISNTDEISAKVDDTSITTNTNDALKVADTYKTIFVGTQAQWNALSTADKVKYNEAHITDDVIGGEVADVVQDGLMSPVTSNAVYDALIMVPKFISTTLLADVSGNSSTTYTATQDCWVTGWLTYNSKLGGHNPTIRIGGTTGPVVATVWNNGSSSESEGLSMYVPVCFPLKKNQTAYFIQSNTSVTPGRQIFNCKVYAMFS